MGLTNLSEIKELIIERNTLLKIYIKVFNDCCISVLYPNLDLKFKYAFMPIIFPYNEVLLSANYA
jgi:hypothetical protein